MYKEFKFNLARNSLRYLIKLCGIKEIYIPYYLCDVIRHAVVEENCKPIFYHIDDKFYPMSEFPSDGYVLYPNYFGVCDANVKKLENIYSNLIVDNAHAFYLPPQGFACFNSERKFCDVNEGSYLYIKNNKIANNTQNINLRCCPEQRIKRFIELHKKYENTNKLNMDIGSIKSPFCYPYLAIDNKAADMLAEKLTKEGIVIYRYWNNLPKNYNEYKFYRRLVPIPL